MMPQGELIRGLSIKYPGPVDEIITIDEPRVVALCEELAELIGVSVEDAVAEAVSDKLRKLEALASSD